ncbi:DUF4872 domain-containing protein [Heyndrickxia oleronia]
MFFRNIYRDFLKEYLIILDNALLQNAYNLLTEIAFIWKDASKKSWRNS